MRSKKRPKPQKLTPAQFDNLQAEWYAKLAKAGFKELEDPQGRLRNWHSFDLPRIHKQDMQQYFLDAQTFLNEHSFESHRERIIWQMHSEGLFLREIAAALKCSKDTIHASIKKLKKEFYVKFSSYKKL